MLRCLLAAALATLLAGAALAAPTACPQHFLDGDAPDLVNPKLARDTREICYDAFAVLHSGLTRTPLWAAEHLTRARLAAAQDVTRRNRFHADPHLPRSQRAELTDYARSGYDRGHLAPSADMPNRRAQRQSFSLANIIPQNSDSNRGLWEAIESAVRDLAEADGELYVVSGPMFQGTTLKQLKGRVLVPSGIFKALYDPKRRQAGAYTVPNAAGDRWKAVSIAQLEAIAGIDPFPDLPPAVKVQVMPLPEPRMHGHALPGSTAASEPSVGAPAGR